MAPSYFPTRFAQALPLEQRPLIGEAALFQIGAAIHRQAMQGKLTVTRLPEKFDQAYFRRVLRKLSKEKLIAPDAEFRSGIWQNLSVPPAATAEEAFCLVDPHAHIAFLSAMQRHGLTDRSPHSLQMMTLPDLEWRRLQMADWRNKMGNETNLSEAPKPIRPRLRRTLRGRSVDLTKSKTTRDIIPIRGTFARITTIGSTFVDMLEEPAKCGGMSHVIACFEHHYAANAQEIIDEVDRLAKGIAKVRAGYIVDELLRSSDPRTEKWLAFAQRGGSRLLDPQRPYGGKFSEKWMIATNV